MMASFLQELLIGFPFTSAAYLGEKSSKRYLPDPATQYITSTTSSKQGGVNSVLTRMNKLGRKTNIFATGLKEHVKLGQKITDTVKGKLSLGARILQVGGVKKVFMQLFSVKDGEKLLKASQCYLSTTSGPLAGLLFISTDKVAFCSERSIKAYSSKGHLIRIHYKVVIPLEKIRSINQSQHVKKPSPKYIEIVTVDDFDFWFMGFLNYQKAFKYLKQIKRSREHPSETSSEFVIMEPETAKLGSSLLVDSVKELAKEALIKVPERYVHPNIEPPILFHKDTLPQLPIIDLNKLLSEDVTELEKLDFACKEWGFFQLVNHGVGIKLVEDIKKGAQELLNLSIEEKKKLWQKPGGRRGLVKCLVIKRGHLIG
ncbi:hypothetical protein JHK86_054729 [Glycine max]|nr:hypothetical protein JHK86_054729 [Glycine max]